MGNSFGQIFRITTFGESHGPAVGASQRMVMAGMKSYVLFLTTYGLYPILCSGGYDDD